MYNGVPYCWSGNLYRLAKMYFVTKIILFCSKVFHPGLTFLTLDMFPKYLAKLRIFITLKLISVSFLIHWIQLQY